MCACVVISPFVNVRSTKFLTVASTLSMISILFFICIVLYDAAISYDSSIGFSRINWLPDLENLDIIESIMAFPVLFMAFNFLYNFFPITDSLKNPTSARMQQSGYLGISISLTTYSLVAFSGYLTYGSDI